MSKGYPRFRFHKEQEARVVRNEEEDEALGEGWGSWAEIFGNGSQAVVVDKTPVGSTSDSWPSNEPEEHQKTYREHMAEWESKAEKSLESLTNKELVERLIQKGIPAKDLKGLNKAKLVELVKG